LRVLSSLLVAVVCLAVPSAALAAEYTVNSTGDQTDAVVGTGGCLTGVATCTLRAAIEESNFSTGTKDTITFSGEVFEGKAVDTIAPVTALPTIVDPVNVFGGECATEAGPEGPCAGVDGPSSASVLKVENANGVTVAGLAVTGGVTGINVINSSEEFAARADWIGVKLDGSAAGNTTGIFLDPDSDKAKIGGPEPEERNVFANNAGDGLDVLGADEVQVLGNYFGVEPDGTTVASNGKDIEVNSTSVGGFTASDDVIGRALAPGAAASAECDGGCNVISGASLTGLDLQGDGGQEAPSVATHVEGNFIGLNAAGTSVKANGTYDVMAGSAKKALIGGPTSAEANYFAGGSFGVYAENANALEVLGNVIGRNVLGAEVTPPSLGLFIFCLSTTEPAVVSGNALSMAGGGIGIEHRFTGATITENTIEGGLTGIKTVGSADGSLIEGNLVEGASENGILIENDLNKVAGNEVLGAGSVGIRVKYAGTLPLVSPTTENVVGGNAAGEENVISGSGSDAIEIVDMEETANEVARNRGSGSGGLFIDLVATEPGPEPNGPNKGIQPPTIAAAKLTGASGSGALPGATVRVFRKATASPGELESFLGEAEADGSGNWSITYAAAIPGETPIAATQTFEGTSELALATTEPAPKPPKEAGGKDTTPPETRITKGPQAKTHSRKAKFKFTSSEAGSSFECKLDRKPFKPCKSPKKYKGLKPGKHVFKVRAIDAAGNVDPTPAKKKFKVLP
jgi:CSLREA domain-containing protein